MSKGKPVVSADVKQQILERIKNEGASISQIAQEHGISNRTIYGWLSKGAKGQPTWMELTKLKRENRALKEILGRVMYEKEISQKKN
jgi:transposase-like protein